MRPRAGAAIGFAFGLGANLLALRFVPEVIGRFTSLPAAAAWTALVLLAAAQALPWAVAGAGARLVRTRWQLPTPLAFAAFVYLATFIPAIFPWTPAGGLARWPIFLQSADVIGERGVTFVLAFACALVGQGWRSARIAGAILAVLAGHGALRMSAIESARASAPHARVALVEPDFDAFDRWDEQRAAMMIDRLTTLTEHAEKEDVALTVWPESAYPFTLSHGTHHAPYGKRAVLQRDVHGPVLTGVYMTKGHGIGTNSAVLATSGGELSPSYDKRHLLWFGETVPFGDVFPILRRVFARGTGLDPGTESIAFEAGPIALAVLNCYEDTLPQAGREAMKVHPNLLVNVTNDAWFAGSAEGELHLRLATLRAIEARRDFVRAVNRGPTTWVDATGRIQARREAVAGTGAPPPLVVNAALLSEPLTLYAWAGDAPLVVLLLGTLVLRIRNATGRRGGRESH